MGYKVDIASFNKPDIDQLRKDFGDIVDPVGVNPVPLELFSMIGLTGAAQNPPNNSKAEGSHNQSDTYSNDRDYDLIINTHGDPLPYYRQTKASNNNKRIMPIAAFRLSPTSTGRH